MKTSLIHTERKLVALFVGGAFLFLLVFEGFFLFSRFIFEETISKSGFASEMQRIENHEPDMGRRGRDIGPRIGMTVLSIDKSGSIVNERGWEEASFDEEDISLAFLSQMQTGTVIKIDGILIYKKARPDMNDIYQVFIRKSGYPVEDLLRDILRFLILDILIIAPFYFMGRYFVRKTLEPVEENIDTMSHFIHDAGHELKTPLSIVSGNLQLLRDTEKRDPALIEESIETIHAMSDSLDGLLELSNVKQGAKNESLLLSNAFLLEWEKEKSKAIEKNITLEMKIPENATIAMDSRHFSLLFGNLLRNAVIYNKNGGSIMIRLKNNVITLADTGVGIDQKHLKKIWERFYRVERSGVSPGTGIGLTLVEKIINLYDWKIEVSSKLGEGTEFRITIK